MAYDEKCEELAEYFLEGVTGEPEPTEVEKQSLAQAIQDAVENWFSGRKAVPREF